MMNTQLSFTSSSKMRMHKQYLHKINHLLQMNCKIMKLKVGMNGIDKLYIIISLKSQLQILFF